VQIIMKKAPKEKKENKIMIRLRRRDAIPRQSFSTGDPFGLKATRNTRNTGLVALLLPPKKDDQGREQLGSHIHEIAWDPNPR